MKIPIRMIGLATTFFWLFLIIFFVSAVYSVRDVDFDLGQPWIEMTSDNEMLFSLPITIDNRGYYNINSFNITTRIFDEENYMITHGSTSINTVERGREITSTHNMTIEIGSLLQSDQNYLFNDSELEIYTSIGMKIAEVVPVQVSTNLSIPWGAPLYGFTLNEVEYSAFNDTHVRAIIPVSFENHASFDLVGRIRIGMFDNTGMLLGEGQTLIEALQTNPYQGNVELDISMANNAHVPENGYFEVYFLTQLFDSGPVVIPRG